MTSVDHILFDKSKYVKQLDYSSLNKNIGKRYRLNYNASGSFATATDGTVDAKEGQTGYIYGVSANNCGRSDNKYHTSRIPYYICSSDADSGINGYQAASYTRLWFIESDVVTILGGVISLLICKLVTALRRAVIA